MELFVSILFRNGRVSSRRISKSASHLGGGALDRFQPDAYSCKVRRVAPRNADILFTRESPKSSRLERNLTVGVALNPTGARSPGGDSRASAQCAGTMKLLLKIQCPRYSLALTRLSRWSLPPPPRASPWPSLFSAAVCMLPLLPDRRVPSSCKATASRVGWLELGRVM
jgi:hypothetical protein